jgi:uncharacterized protein (TIGR02391 family)
MCINLQACLNPDLWATISNSYEAGNYTHAILDATHMLSNVLRDKSGCEGDGEALASQTLGGNQPRLKINKFQTETEQNEQKGLFHLVVGLYKNVRNPRSHEQMNDKKETADTLILFVNYLIDEVNKSQPLFELGIFLDKIFDPDFVDSKRYAELIVAEIPENKRVDTLIEIYRKKLDGKGRNIALTVKVVLNILTEEQKNIYLKIVSDELSITSNEKVIICNLKLLPPNLWQQIDEKARLRIENKIIKSIEEGIYSPFENKCLDGKGSLGTWGRTFLNHFTSIDTLKTVLINKFRSESTYQKIYVINFFFLQLPKIFTYSYNIDECINVISEMIKKPEEAVVNIFRENYYMLPEKWREKFKYNLEILSESNPELWSYINDEEIPF